MRLKNRYVIRQKCRHSEPLNSSESYLFNARVDPFFFRKIGLTELSYAILGYEDTITDLRDKVLSEGHVWLRR
jgi:hypothetical protein